MSRRHSQRHNTLIASTLALTVSIVLAAGDIAASDDMANVRVRSVTPTGDGTYDISGIAVDTQVNPACALALASGRCMFSCGPGSLLCEGGTTDLPFGRFELLDLPTEADGSIRLQVFIEGHVALATPIAPEPPLPGEAVQWGVINDFCCPSERSTFEVTIGGVTKRSVVFTCGQEREWEPTWEGWASISSMNDVQVQAEVAQTDETCEPFSTERTDLLPTGGCYLYRLEAVNGNPEVSFDAVDCDNLR